MVALVKRVKKLEKKVADRPQSDRLDDRIVYQPSEEELAEAVAILVECKAVKEMSLGKTYQLGLRLPSRFACITTK